MKKVRFWAVLAIGFMSVMSLKAQGQRMNEFQNEFSKYLNRFNPESLYRNNDPADDVRLIPVGFVNNNWKCDTTTAPEVFWAKPKKEQ